MTLAEQWKAEGEAKGLAKGRAEGRAEAHIALIVRILETRQKMLTPAQRATIEQCSDIGCLDAWVPKALTLEDPRELFEPTA